MFRIDSQNNGKFAGRLQRLKVRSFLILAVTILATTPVFGADGHAESLSPLWILPFAGILLCIAVVPMVNAHFWEHNLWWVSLGVFALPMSLALVFVMGEALRHLAFEKALEYVSFIMLLASLFIISGGILVRGNMHGTPATNARFLLVGSLIASLVGTTGASMLLIRPMLRANMPRQRKAHVVVFFIFLVSNLGGLLTPLGDPPLFLGYLQGVPFEWTLRLFPQWLFATGIVLIIFYAYDVYLFRKEDPELFQHPGVTLMAEIEKLGDDVDRQVEKLDVMRFRREHKIPLKVVIDAREAFQRVRAGLDYLGNFAPREGIRIVGQSNLLLLVGVVATIYGQGYLTRELDWWPHFGPQEAAMGLLAALSLAITPFGGEVRRENAFTFAPIKEVAFLFAGIFATMIPALYILQQQGAALGVREPWQFFWASGVLSSFLDNAPTYLTFLSVGKGVALQLGLSNDLGFVLSDGQFVTRKTLEAISCGSVFMGANTYIGNGPNFMVRAIAEEEGVTMPSFFGYMAYSGAVLIPVFILTTFLFFVSWN